MPSDTPMSPYWQEQFAKEEKEAVAKAMEASRKAGYSLSSQEKAEVKAAVADAIGPQYGPVPPTKKQRDAQLRKAAKKAEAAAKKVIREAEKQARALMKAAGIKPPKKKKAAKKGGGRKRGPGRPKGSKKKAARGPAKLARLHAGNYTISVKGN